MDSRITSNTRIINDYCLEAAVKNTLSVMYQNHINAPYSVLGTVENQSCTSRNKGFKDSRYPSITHHEKLRSLNTDTSLSMWGVGEPLLNHLAVVKKYQKHIRTNLKSQSKTKKQPYHHSSWCDNHTQTRMESGDMSFVRCLLTCLPTPSLHINDLLSLVICSFYRV